MNITQIINSVQIIEELMSQKLKMATAYKLKKVAAEVAIVVEGFETKRKELLEKYATINEDGTEYQFEQEGTGLDDFNREIAEYLDGSDKLTLDIQKIAISELENVEIETTKLGFIDWFIEE